MKYSVAASILAVLAAAPASAHMALWGKGMYGGEPDNLDADALARPMAHKNFNEWWFHGMGDQPPPEGEFLELPAGGKTESWVSCSKHFTPLAGDHMYGQDDTTDGGWACPSGRDKEGNPTGMEHSVDPWSTPMDQLKDVRGCALSIAYESDFSKLKPEDFVVISTLDNCPWRRDAFFEIPQDLPECPEGGCHCLFGWQHGPGGGGEEMCQNGFRCKVTGATKARALPKPQLARKCPFDKNNCTLGAKQMFYWQQNERNNIETDMWDPPFYNNDFGFANGAQKDLWFSEDYDLAEYEKGYSTETAPVPNETRDWTDQEREEKSKVTENAYLASATPKPAPQKKRSRSFRG